MKKKYYKVVDRIDLSSARALNWYSETYTVYYKLNEWTTAHNNSRLFVFDDLKEAFKFKQSHEDVYECEIKGGIKFFGCDSRKNIHSFWQVFNKIIQKKKKMKKEYFEKYYIGLTCISAILAKKVKLTKLVTE